MNDIIDNFVNTAKDNYQQKQEPSKLAKFFGASSTGNDLENAPHIKLNESISSSSTAGTAKAAPSNSWNQLKSKIGMGGAGETQQTQADDGFAVFNKVDNKKDYTKGFIAMGVGAVFLLFSFFALPTVVLSPQKFTMFFTLAVICFLSGLAFMNGPQAYLKKLTQRRNLIASSVLVGSMILSFYFSVINSNYLLSLFFCFIEVNSNFES